MRAYYCDCGKKFAFRRDENGQLFAGCRCCKEARPVIVCPNCKSLLEEQLDQPDFCCSQCNHILRQREKPVTIWDVPWWKLIGAMIRASSGGPF